MFKGRCFFGHHLFFCFLRKILLRIGVSFRIKLFVCPLLINGRCLFGAFRLTIEFLFLFLKAVCLASLLLLKEVISSFLTGLEFGMCLRTFPAAICFRYVYFVAVTCLRSVVWWRLCSEAEGRPSPCLTVPLWLRTEPPFGFPSSVTQSLMVPSSVFERWTWIDYFLGGFPLSL